jgi:ABC-type spermidine/putrescine transport system permease subunit II
MTARALHRLSPFNAVSLALGLAFLYLPIVILVIYSFNASRLVTVWGGWSLRWYTEFFHDRAMLEAALMSFRVAAVSATLATLLGTLAAVALSRAERFRGRTLFSAMLYAPLVMPEVITGLSLLLLFVAVNAERGFWTVTIAHTTLTMCFVAVVVQSRLGALDRSLEEAAMDLGCNPARAFVSVTLPLIAPLDAERGFWTVTIAHTTLTMCFVAVVVQSRLGPLDRSPQPGGGGDGSRLRPGAGVSRRDAAADPACDRRRVDAGVHAVARRSRDREFYHRPRLGDAADPDLFGGAARRKTRDQRDLHAGDRPDRGGDYRGFAGLETVERARRERGAVVDTPPSASSFETPRCARLLRMRTS